MVNKCFLETDGYRILFELTAFNAVEKYADVVIEFRLNPLFGEVAVKSVPTLIAISDLQRLVAYFDRHIADLKQNPDSESYTFITTDLGFQVQALSGEIRSQNDGEFSIRFMVNVSESNREGYRVYVGGESLITLENIQSFGSSLRAVLSDIARE